MHYVIRYHIILISLNNENEKMLKNAMTKQYYNIYTATAFEALYSNTIDTLVE